MKIHEYQAKQLLEKFRVPIPQGGVATSAHEAYQIAESWVGIVLSSKPRFMPAAGARAAASRWLLPVRSSSLADAILGMTLVTHQTGPEGRLVKKVLVEQGLDIKQELYLGIVLDRAEARPVIMMSAAGGMEIEEVAAKTPELIFKEAVDPAVGLQPYQTRNLAFGVGLDPQLLRTAASFITNLYQMFQAYDCSLVEINPLVVTSDGQMLALDAKVTFDDNALYRHKDLLPLEDPDEKDPLELEAAKHNLNYIRLDGTIGAMVNGAGLAMATMDLIKLAGAEPANFLDVGGGASADMIANGFRIILSDPRVKAILINIFGGILRCDVLAEGVISAAKQVNVNVPIIIRLEGTNREIGRDLLGESGLNFTVAGDMLDAARKVAALA